MPLAVDQMGSCYRVERLGIGVSLGNNPKSKDFVEVIGKVVEKEKDGKDNQIQLKMKRVQKMIHFKELRSGNDMAQMMRKVIKYDKWS